MTLNYTLACGNQATALLLVPGSHAAPRGFKPLVTHSLSDNQSYNMKQYPSYFVFRTAASLACGATFAVLGQGTFQNLNFEAANLLILAPGQSATVSVADALPGWTAWLGTNQQALVAYNATTLGNASISVIGPNYSQLGPIIPPIEGNFNAILMAGMAPGGSVAASISQVGTVPANAQSIQFKTSMFPGEPEDFMLSLNGVTVSLQPVSVTSTYATWGGNIQSFAGRQVELRITAFPTAQLPTYNFWVDSVIFSSELVPEPGVFGLSALGALLTGWYLLRQRRC
jgi:hypothetical protein